MLLQRNELIYHLWRSRVVESILLYASQVRQRLCCVFNDIKRYTRCRNAVCIPLLGSHAYASQVSRYFSINQPTCSQSEAKNIKKIGHMHTSPYSLRKLGRAHALGVFPSSRDTPPEWVRREGCFWLEIPNKTQKPQYIYLSTTINTSTKHEDHSNHHRSILTTSTPPHSKRNISLDICN